MYDIPLIKSRMNCVSYAQRHGLPIAKSGDRCISPLRENARNPTSFVVFDDFYYDYASGDGGDVIELCAALAHGGDRGAAIRDLARLTGVVSDGIENTRQWLDYTNRMNSMTAYYHTQLTEADRDYLHSRGLTDADIDRLMIGRVTDGTLKGRLFLPYFSGKDGYVCYYATRVMPDSAFQDSKYMKAKRDEHNQHLPWGLQTLIRSGDTPGSPDTLVIAEGYFDAVSFECAGYPVLSAITGRFSKDQLPIVLSVARKFARVFIVYDNDNITHAGDSFAYTMSQILTRNRIPFIVGTVPQPYHDISEYYAAGGDLSRVLDSAQDGITYVATRLTDFSELETFIYTVARHTKRTVLENLFQQLRLSQRWNPDALKSLLKSATTAPPENIVADEILREHQLVYLDAVGFYEYAAGVWKRQSSKVIETYANKTLGEFSTNNRCRAITDLVKTRAFRSDIEFDKQPVWNFVNGTLELETGTFREHSPTDYCSVQASYPYNPSASYSAWSTFIDDVSAGDPRVCELLQLICGYVFFSENRHEKIFVLTGSGGNGKTVYLTILKHLFGDSHVSYLKPRELLKDFKLIQLKESIVNIAGEIRSDLRDAEEVMKSVASGEPQLACYKGKDFINFIPRTKLIYACNGQLSSGDTSEGLTRRLIIVDFKVSFVDNPEPGNPYQKPKNINIIDTLTDELNSGGVFNWAYEGYKLLRTVGYFTETHDQTQLIHDFKRSSNPVLVFWEDNHGDFGETVANQALYRLYNQWCSDNGVKIIPSVAFHREFKKVSGEVYESYRTAQERGYRKIPATKPEFLWK